MRGRTIRGSLAALGLALILALPASAAAATPFSAGDGTNPAVAVGPDGSGHVVWDAGGDNAMVGYCRISPGAEVCNRTELLEFGAATDANSAGRPQVFAPAPNKVVIAAGCWNCPPGGATDRTYRWISLNNGSSFPGPVPIGSQFRSEGTGAWLDDFEIFVGVGGSHVKAMKAGETGNGVQYATGGTFSFEPAVVRVPGTNKLVAAVNDLDLVKFGVYTAGVGTTLAINTSGNWLVDRTLSSAEAQNSDSSLNTGPNGVFLTYLSGPVTDRRIGLRAFGSATNAFGAPAYIEGDDPIDDNEIDYPKSFQDPSGRIHVVWRSLHDEGRLRYTVSDTGGSSFAAPQNLAASETFLYPEIAAGADGEGFAAWRNFGSEIRVVPIDPQPEGGGGGEPDGSDVPGAPPTIDDFTASDTDLEPGEGTEFTFTSNESGTATLTIEKRVKGLKVKKKGKKKCVPRTKKRLKALRQKAGSKAEFRKLVRKRACKRWKRIGRIRRAVTIGSNEIIFNGRVAGKRLGPGVYRAKLVVVDGAGDTSRAERLRFKVRKRR